MSLMLTLWERQSWWCSRSYTLPSTRNIRPNEKKVSVTGYLSPCYLFSWRCKACSFCICRADIKQPIL